MKTILRKRIFRLAETFGFVCRERDIKREPRERRRSGRATKTMEIVRDGKSIPPLSSFWLDLKLGARMLRKHWALTLIGGLAMAAAMTIGAALFNLINVMWGTSLPLEDGDRVVIVQPFDPETLQTQNTVAQVFEHWRREIHSLVDLGAFRDVERDLKTGNTIDAAVNVGEMSASGFTLARIVPKNGRFLLPEDELPGAPPVVVIGYEVWQSTFAADPDIVGQQVHLDGVSHTVVGVMPDGFRFPVNHQYWTCLRAKPSDRVTVFARLAPGATLESAQAELGVVGFGESGPVAESGRPPRPSVRPYIAGLTGERSIWIAVLLPLVLPLLLIPPCTNIGALIYARTVARQGEFAARAALGASRSRIVVQIFLEALVLAGASAIVAIVFAPKVSKTLSFMLPTYGQPFWMDFGVSYGTILFAAGLAVIAAMISGAIPALRATGRWQPAALNALQRSSPPRLGRAWTAIIVVQVALSVAVLPISIEFAWNMLRPAILGPGFPVEEFLTARLDLTTGENPAAAATRFSILSNEMVRQLEAEPGITAVALSAYKPFKEPSFLVEVDSSAPAPSPESVVFNQVDAAFFNAFEIRLLAGRGFEPADSDPQRRNVLVNRSFVNQVLAGENPLGRTVRVRSRNAPASRYEIIGLVENQFTYSKQPTIYRPLTPTAAIRESGDVLSVHLAIHTGPRLPPGFEMRLREIASATAPTLSVDDVQPLNEIYFFLSLVEYIGGSLQFLIALGILLFATVVIYTRMSFDVEQRRREIGIRSVLGASPLRLVAGIFRGVLIPVAAGAALGGLVALLIDFYLSPLLFNSAGGRPLPWILPAAEAFVLLMGVVALFGPVRRTLRVDPVSELRAE